jgi:hypothetical protein
VRHMRGEWEIWPLVRVVRRMDGPSERLVSESYGGFRKILFCEHGFRMCANGAILNPVRYILFL